ncbi:Mor family transcriptional regulator [Acidovorax sp. 94]|nr:Mor family transcriptional regulator [Acidovorax sp. 94]
MLDAAQLAPLHQQLDAGYPENLRTVAEWLFVQLVEDEEVAPTPERQHKLATLALRQTERLSAEEGGRNFYLGKGLRYRASLRDREMYERFNGRNYNELAREYHLTPTRVRQIMDAMHQDDISRRQGRLILE